MTARARKITANIPEDVLARAMKTTGKGITETLVEGLRELEKREQRSALRALKGRVRLELDLEETRR